MFSFFSSFRFFYLLVDSSDNVNASLEYIGLGKIPLGTYLLLPQNIRIEASPAPQKVKGKQGLHSRDSIQELSALVKQTLMKKPWYTQNTVAAYVT